MAELSLEQKKAIAIAAARKKQAEQAGNVVATIEDGEIREMSDGRRVFVSPGYSTSDPAKVEELSKGARPVDLMQGELDRERIAANPIAARVQEFNQGVPLVGEYLDEVVGLVAPQAAENMRRTSDAMERENPIQSAGLNLAGGIAYTAPVAIAGAGDRVAQAGNAVANFVARGGTVATRGARAGIAAAPAAAVEGAVSMAGRGEAPDERASNAGMGAIVGGTLGAVLGPIASMTGEAVTALARRVKNLDVRAIADEFGLSAPAARIVRDALQADDLATASTRLRQLGDDAMLADAGPATSSLLNAAAKSGGPAVKTAGRAVSARSDALANRLPSRLNAILGSPRGTRASARDISARTAPARKAAYDRAYGTPIDYAGGSGRQVEDALSRIAPQTLTTAIREANDEMRSLGIKNRQIMAQIGEDGSVVFQEMPNVQQLDEIKKALDGIAREAIDKFGRPTQQGVRARRLAGDLRQAIVDATGGDSGAYARALKIGGDKIKEDAALDMGKRLLWKNTTVEDVREFMSQGVSVDARNAARQGLRETIEETLSNVRRTITDPDTDAREAMQIVKEISSRANIEKVKLVLGEGRARNLMSELDRTATALQLRSALARNSDTAINQAIQGNVRAEAQPGLVQRTAGNIGNPFDAGREVTQAIAGIDPASMSRREREYFGEIAKALTEIQGNDARRALISVRRAMAGQPIKEADAEMIGRVIASSGGASAYLYGRQTLGQQ